MGQRSRSTPHPRSWRASEAPCARSERMGGNGGPPLDPLIMTQAIPALQNSLPGAIVAVPAGFLDLTGPASDAIGGLHEALTERLIKQIQAIDPDYHYESLGPARTFEGRVNE